MKQLKLFENVREKEIQLRERSATTLIPNSAYGEVTNRVKPEGGSCWAAMQVKVLSPEITIVSEADTFHFVEGNILTAVRGEGVRALAGSEAVARQQRDSVGTRENQGIYQKKSLKFSGIGRDKPIDGKELHNILWWSDYPIVLQKQGNACGEKGVAGMRGDSRDTSATLRGGDQMSTKLLSLTQRARGYPKHRFTQLIDLLSEEFLKRCFWELKREKASGVDGVTVKEYEANLEENIRDLVDRMKAWRYRPKPVRRVYISKPDGKRRPLGIPTVEDKIVQMGIKKILEAIFEVDFLDVSYGFRPKRDCHQALQVLDKAIMTRPVNFVVDMDIEKFFDTVEHKWLMRCLEQRVKDPHFLRLIGRFLNAGIIEEGKFIPADRGTPQGAVLSPVLANIYLHYILDLWFERVIKGQLKGFVQMVRYADDFVVCFQSGSEAKRFAEALEQRVGKFGLKIAREKSQIIEFGRYVWQRAQREGEKVATFDFLGFTHYGDKTRKGGFKLGRKTARRRYAQKLKGLNQWLRNVRNLVELGEWWQVLRQKLVGHYRYYGVSGNMPSIRVFYTKALRLAHKWINRRSQKRSYNWRQFLNFVKYNPLPQPKIYHLTYTLSSH